MSDILIFGTGNPSRQDDCLGIEFSDCIEKWIMEEKLDIDVDCNYQLNIEDATNIAPYKLVIFVDGSKEDINNFIISKIEPSQTVEVLSHSCSPATVIYLCSELFDCQPEAFLLHIKGFGWELNKPPTPGAIQNLNLAIQFLKDTLTPDSSLNVITQKLYSYVNSPIP
jgi:Ni,Fe-hydrogenase maturation factor